jgi:hypothetical protein
MKLKLWFVPVLLLLSSCVMPLPPGFTLIRSANERVEAYGYSIQVPDAGWLKAKSDYGYSFGQRVDDTVSSHAGIAVFRAETLTSHEAFIEVVRKQQSDLGDSFRYKVLRTDFKESARDGLEFAIGREDFDDYGAVNKGKREFLATRTATLFAWDPREPGKMVKLWYSWRGHTFVEPVFDQNASRFFSSLQKASAR